MQGGVEASHGRSKCDECGRSFSSAHGLARHKSHHSKKRYKCHFCPKKYKTLKGLRKHEALDHIQQGWFKCPLCNYCGKTIHGLSGHFKRMHPNEPQADMIPQVS